MPFTVRAGGRAKANTPRFAEDGCWKRCDNSVGSVDDTMPYTGLPAR